jgi:hypothetical protein
MKAPTSTQTSLGKEPRDAAEAAATYIGHVHGSTVVIGSRKAQDQDASLPMFNIERVSLQFNISSDFVAAAVANNVLILALSTGRILRIDLDSPADIDGS